MHVSRLAIIAAAILAIAGQQGPQVTAIEKPPVELRVKVSDSILVLGDVDTIRVIIKNTLTLTARLTFSSQCQDQVYIRNSSNAVVLPPSGGYTCAPVISQLSILPGDSVVRTYLWTGGQSFLPPDPATKLPVGRYLVSAALQATNYSVSAFPVAIRLAATR
jgi:hypothetical protein